LIFSIGWDRLSIELGLPRKFTGPEMQFPFSSSGPELTSPVSPSFQDQLRFFARKSEQEGGVRMRIPNRKIPLLTPLKE
jgi:hypothetical protein